MTFIKRMKEVGISVSMDDFGTGYSSLSMLRDVDVDIVKIDKSFVDIVTKGDDLGTQFFKNVVKMIHDLERDTVSEGVETKQQVEILKKTECHVAQGYYFDKPLPEQEFFERVKAPHEFYKDK
jgi:sensor c-di-GMP phosphodiesterase-like protein